MRSLILLQRRNQGSLAPTESDLPHQDRPFATAPAAQHQALKAAFDWTTAGIDLADVRWRGTFKQTFGRRKLRSHRGENAEVEATWSLVGLWSLSLHAQVELAADAIPASGVSVAGLLRAYRGSMKEYREVPGPGESLWQRLSVAVIDGYKRSSKASREYPRKKQEPAIGAPKIRPATRSEIERARQIKYAHQERSTAWSATRSFPPPNLQSLPCSLGPPRWFALLDSPY